MVAMYPFGLLLLASSVLSAEVESTATVEEYQQGQHVLEMDGLTHSPYQADLESHDVFHVYDCQVVKQTLHPSTLRICKHCLEMHETRSYAHNVHKRHD